MALLATIALSGCVQSTPKCSDEATVKMAKELFAKQLTEFATGFGAKLDVKQVEAKIKFDFISASKFEENIKKYTCDAMLIDASDGKKMPVSYTSQINDDGEHIVAIGGLSETIVPALSQALITPVSQVEQEPEPASQTDAEPAVPHPQLVIPDTIDKDEAMKALDAAPGYHLAGSPKLTPDRKMYYLSGKIDGEISDSAFVARHSRPQEELVLAALSNGGYTPPDNNADYFVVVLPEQFQSYYASNARINGGFDLVGYYGDNSPYPYEVVGGGKGKVPMFTALYLNLWDARLARLVKEGEGTQKEPGQEPVSSASEEDGSEESDGDTGTDREN